MCSLFKIRRSRTPKTPQSLRNGSSIRVHAQAIIARFLESNEKSDEFLQWNQQSSHARYHMIMKLMEKFRWLECFKDDWVAEVIPRTCVKNAIAEHQRREKKRLEADIEAEAIYTDPDSSDEVKADEGTAPKSNRWLEVC